ncbi:MAG: hypothetical protein JO142_16335 [Burkholderiales bacterium]|nr:hypothetical protein [Burkholderiales bacterium]
MRASAIAVIATTLVTVANAAGDTVPAFAISNRLGNIQRPGEQVYLVKAEDGRWRYARAADTKLDGVERIRVDYSANLPMVYLDAPSFMPNGDLVQMNPKLSDVYSACSREAKRAVEQTRANGFYSTCNSSFTKTKTGLSVIANLLEAPAVISAGTTARLIGINRDEMQKAVAESGVIDGLRGDLAADAARQTHDEYLAAFRNAKTSDQLTMAINQYANNDPDNLIPEATQRRDQLKAAEELAAQKKIQAAAADYVAALERAKKVDEAARAMVTHFRQTLRVGARTNCGPVVEMRGDLMRVYLPVRDYGNDHWIDRSDLFPSGWGCRFVNGNYVPPTLS